MRFGLLMFALILFGSPALSVEQRALNIILFSPNSSDEDFWGDVHSFARASASDLGINFRIVYNALNNRFDYLELIEKELAGPDKPDAFLAVSYLRRTQRLLALSEKYNVPVILINNELPMDTSSAIGTPRSVFKTYLGHITPDDYKMSYQLSNYLIQQAIASDQDQQINIAGIAGSRDTPESDRRNQGLKHATWEHAPQAQLKQIVYANWEGDIARRMSLSLIKRHNELDIIWYASDLMALAAQSAIEQSGQSIITGGFDWTKDAILAIKSGKLTASVGGHFTDGGYALVLLYDYFHGRDFADVTGVTIRSASGVIHRGNVDKYYQLLTQRDWQSIDFKKYSRVFHPQNNQYDFSIERLLK